MATLRFNGAGNKVIGAGQGAMNGALTVAGLLKRGDTGGSTLLYVHQVTSTTTDAFSFILGSGGATSLDFYRPPTFVSGPSGWLSGSTDWLIVALTRTAGSSTPRFHLKNITTGSAWLHADAGGSSADPSSASGGGLQIGAYRSSAGTDDLNGDVGLFGFWDGTALNDTQIESLAASLATSAWNALTPSSLTELNTATPTDLKGLVTWTVSGATLAGGDPPGWTFGLAVPPTNTVAPAVTGTPVNGQVLTCSTGTWTGTPTAYTYQWKRNGTAIGGATASTYTLVTADKGTSVKCTVTASNAGGSASTDSNAVSVSSTLDALPDAGSVLIRTSTGWIELT